MSSNSDPPLKEYIGEIEIGDDPPVPLSVWAVNASTAYHMVVQQYGEGHVISLWNEDEANTVR
ncbi:hypothetical protein AB0J72_21750 [Dactylosporangium sp. NPDC049742]|uniref:hypothetical protein n=1 Tax=Dactylosporangium sp. NPDC049742 TaxID=3154737 RepID=UPI00342BD909